MADKSALARLSARSVDERLAPMIRRGEVATCSIVQLEYLFSARSARDYEVTRQQFETGYPKVGIDQKVLDRSVEVQSQLANRGQHRGVAIPDLIIAATAEVAGLIVLHYDADFDLLAEVTGQPTEWVVPRGTID